MAKNWSLREAANEILAGNKEAIVDVGRRFPLTANAIAAMGKNDGALTIIGALPDHISARKIESVLKDGVQEIDDTDEEDVAEEKPVKNEKATKSAKEEKKPVDKKKAAKKPAMNEPEDDEEDLESMSEVELYKLCKSKKIKAAPKQDKAYYIALLQPEEVNDEDDDWEEEEEEKPTKKSNKKTTKKSKKEDEDEEDDWDI